MDNRVEELKSILGEGLQSYNDSDPFPITWFPPEDKPFIPLSASKIGKDRDIKHGILRSLKSLIIQSRTISSNDDKCFTCDDIPTYPTCDEDDDKMLSQVL